MQLARFSNSSRVLLRPPVAQVARRVELAALVVEAVGQLVADGARRCCRSSARRPSSGRRAAAAARRPGS